MTTTKSPNGSAVAAILAAGIGLLALGTVVLLTELNATATDVVFGIGKAWIPGAEGIGPYAGKETVMLAAWLGSWALLHPLLHKRSMHVRPWVGITLGSILVATLLVWPPVWHFLGA